MDTLLFYLDLGLKHVLDPNGYDHVLFLTALALPFALKKNQICRTTGLRIHPHPLYLLSTVCVRNCQSLCAPH